MQRKNSQQVVTASAQQSAAAIQFATFRALGDVDKHLAVCRAKWPGNFHKLTALNEEVGKLNRAMLHLHYQGGSAESVYHYAITVAAMAVRVATEGDTSFPAYVPGEVRP